MQWDGDGDDYDDALSGTEAMMTRKAQERLSVVGTLENGGGEQEMVRFASRRRMATTRVTNSGIGGQMAGGLLQGFIRGPPRRRSTLNIWIPRGSH